MQTKIHENMGSKINLVSQNIIVKGWTFEQAMENVPFLHVVLNDLVKYGKVDVELEQPESGIFIYRISDADPDQTFTFSFLVHPNLEVDIFNISG